MEKILVPVQLKPKLTNIKIKEFKAKINISFPNSNKSSFLDKITSISACVPTNKNFKIIYSVTFLVNVLIKTEAIDFK